MRFNEFITEDSAKSCPAATQDITLNLKNRQKAIDEYGYGPLNPDLPNTKFWMAKVDEWNLDSAEEAKSSLCGNCAAFDQRQETLDCIAQGIDSDSPADAEGVIDAGELGYCKFLKFKCASLRTCDAWVTGGPLVDKEPVDENLRDWFGKEKWVRMDTKGNIKGPCARGSESEGKPKCLPQAKAHALGKKGRASAAQKKRREDPNPERRGKAINVATKVNEFAPSADRDDNDEVPDQLLTLANRWWNATDDQPKITNVLRSLGWSIAQVESEDDAVQLMHNDGTTYFISADDFDPDVFEQDLDEACWKGYHKEGNKELFGKTVPNCVKNEAVAESHESCPECGGAMYPDTMINEKQDACYYKVKSRYKVWPSAYASGALVQCRKKGAANWGNKSESAEQELDEKWSKKYKRSIDCSNPKGFSQRAHCAGRNKNESMEKNMDELSRILELSSGLSANDRAELNEEFDLIESIIDNLAERNAVDAEAIWEDLESLTDDELYVFATTTPVMEDWQKANKKDRTAGMSQKAVNAYRRENPGSKLQTAVTTKPSKLKKGSKASKRRKSYCSRSRGQMKMHSISCAKTPDKAICKARRRWNCE